MKMIDDFRYVGEAAQIFWAVIAGVVLFSSCRERDYEREMRGPISTICGLKDGDYGYTISFANYGDVEVFNFRGGAIDTRVGREGDYIIYNGIELSRKDWGCYDNEPKK